MMCAEDVSDLRIKGRSGISNGDVPSFFARRCQSTETKTCKSEDEINNFIDSHKIVMAINQHEFISDEFGNVNEDDTQAHIKKFTNFFWLFMDSQKPSSRYYSI